MCVYIFHMDPLIFHAIKDGISQNRCFKVSTKTTTYDIWNVEIGHKSLGHRTSFYPFDLFDPRRKVPFDAFSNIVINGPTQFKSRSGYNQINSDGLNLNMIGKKT